MHSYIVGDDLGAIKRVTYTRKDNSTWQPDTTSLSRGSSKLHAIQKLTIFKQDSETLVRALIDYPSISVFLISVFKKVGRSTS